jgi:integration host factor subunit alpha
MTKADIVSMLRERYGFTNKDIAMVIDQLFTEIRASILAGEDVRLSGFGNFELSQCGCRMGRNPKTGEPKVIPARTMMKFRPSQLFKDEVNEN